jgi:serine phosphatase RsbU (regulator of sigma subunit)
MAIGILSFLYFTYVAIKSVVKKVPYIFYSFVGILILTLATINDSLYSLNVIHTGYLINTGLLFFFFGHSITLSLKYSVSSHKVSELSGKFKRYERLLTKFLSVYSYDLDRILYIIQDDLNIDYLELLINNGFFTCECRKKEEHIVCGKLEKTLKSKVDKYLIEELKDQREITITNRNNVNIASVPIKEEKKIKAILYLEKQKNFTKSNTDILEMIMPQLSTFIDNYLYYYNLENLNKNLEQVIEKRTSQVYQQKEELENKLFELSEKIEELGITSKIIDELNEELNQQKRILGQKNKQLEQYKEQISHQKTLIEEKQKYIKESINYAIKIQNILFSTSYYFPYKEYFIYSSPRDIISGDLLLAYEYENFWVEVVADTTGRNVSASFLTLFIHSLFEDFVQDTPELIYNPDKLIDFLRYQFIKNLDLTTQSNVIEDSFDIGVISIKKSTGEMKYSAARCAGLIVRNDEIIFLEPDNFTIGGHISNYDKVFSVSQFVLYPDDKVYLFTDGYYKQIGQNIKKKFGLSNFLNLLKDIAVYPMTKQQEILMQKFSEWKGSMKRVDDLLIVGFRFSLPQ